MAPTSSATAPSTMAPHRHQQLNDRIDEIVTGRPGAPAGELADSQVEEAVVVALPLADSIARRYRGRGVDIDDLQQVARLGLVKAVRGYRPGGSGFSAYAVPTISGEIKRHFRDHEWLVRPPRSLQELQAKVEECRQRLGHSLRRDASDEEVAQEIGVSAAQVRHAGISRRGYAATTVSTRDLAEIAVADDDYELVLLRLSLRRLLSGLTEREATLYRLRFVEGRSQSEIGVELGVSQVQVSRLLARLLARLRGELDERLAS